ncbi:hypothetical protein GVY41_13920 [Frigidibacter albus]|uniref:Uncharacterized protein n=1 Tax=Frigidibacter albus TaxID=1465486 RepID=A0A6L8VKS9_9RHOB|nr:HK97 gp10 family phage protein [Frigidibacter albus]MZQ90182.1 hypothetical protein [Frigidibacter albus]NBE32093.1 hypothetical protein [Frigidibacter albus]GGH56927.1 hypothetical protein GCM10011341_25870 [Frigidibacter albus]
MSDDLMRQSAKLARRLAAIPAEIVAQVRPALVQGAEDLATMARALVPDDEGDLSASIVVTRHVPPQKAALPLDVLPPAVGQPRIFSFM